MQENGRPRFAPRGRAGSVVGLSHNGFDGGKADGGHCDGDRRDPVRATSGDLLL